MAFNTTSKFSGNISDIVKDDYRTADVFKSFGINYCCSGNITIAEACAVRSMEPDVVVAALEQATVHLFMPNNLDYNEWKPGFLIDYIINVHHAYLHKVMPVLQQQLVSFAKSHSKKNPELQPVVDYFEELQAMLLHQTKQEEEVIFPYIKQIDNAYQRRETYGSLFVRTLRKPFSTGELADKKLESLVTKLREAANFYTFPEKACTNHQVIFHKLKEFDEALVQHKHLENNILYPQINKMEQELLRS